MLSKKQASAGQSRRSGKIYFLGAGASRAFHQRFPLASQLTLNYLLEPSNYDRNAPDVAIGALEEFLRRYRGSSGIGDQLFEKALGELPIESEPCYPYEHSLICLARLLSLVNRSLGASVLDDWLRAVREERSTVLTTNYDTVVEDVLANLGTWEFPIRDMDLVGRDALHWLDYGVPRRLIYRRREPRRWRNPPERSILLLKLHGSISWLYCGGCDKYVLDPLHEEALEYAVTTYGVCPSCGKKTNRQPVIVPPVENKKYEDAAIRAAWRRARKELRSAVEITFAGFSLSRVDRGVRDLLSEAYSRFRTPKIRIVDLEATRLLPVYREIYTGADIQAFNMSWKDFLLGEYGGVSAARGNSAKT
jgi:hypothetical protein